MQSHVSGGRYNFCQQLFTQRICLAFAKRRLCLIAAVLIALPVSVRAQNIQSKTTQATIDRGSDRVPTVKPPRKHRLAQAETAAPSNITGVKLNRGANGLEVVLETAGTIGTLTPQSIGNLRYFDIPNATISQPFQAANPAPGVSSVSVTQTNSGYVRVSVIGTNGAPPATVIAGVAGENPPVAQTAEPELEIDRKSVV